MEDRQDIQDTPPDPNEPVMLCARCARPMPAGTYYCPHCGLGVSQMTPYVPYVNIRFNFSPFADMWKTVKGERDASIAGRIAYFLLIVLLAPVMIIGLPFTIAEWIRNRRKTRVKEPRDDAR